MDIYAGATNSDYLGYWISAGTRGTTPRVRIEKPFHDGSPPRKAQAIKVVVGTTCALVHPDRGANIEEVLDAIASRSLSSRLKCARQLNGGILLDQNDATQEILQKHMGREIVELQ